jgi:hypothetical protein
MGTARTVRSCPHCGGGYRRLDRHLAGRGRCGLAEDRRRRGLVEDQHGAQMAQQRTADEAEKHDAPAPVAPPDDLGAAGLAAWQAVAAAFQVEAHTAPVLEAAARELDLAEAAAAAVAQAGLWVADRYGKPAPHPGIAVARQSRLAAARLLRALGVLEDEQEESEAS